MLGAWRRPIYSVSLTSDCSFWFQHEARFQGAGIARLLSDLQPGYRVLVNLSNDGAPLPSPWTLEPLDAGYKVVDASGQVLGYVYGLDDSRDARIAKSLTRDEARRIASNIAKLPSLVSRRA